MSFSNLDTQLVHEFGIAASDGNYALIKLNDHKFVSIYTIDGYKAVNPDGTGGVDYYVDEVRARVGIITPDGKIHQYEDTLLFDARADSPVDPDAGSSDVYMRAAAITEESVAVFVWRNYRWAVEDPVTTELFILPCYLSNTGKTLLPGIRADIVEPETIWEGFSFGVWNTYSGSGGLTYAVDIGGAKHLVARGFTMNLNSAVIGTSQYFNTGAASNVFLQSHTAINDTKSIISYFSFSGSLNGSYLLPGNFSGTTVSLSSSALGIGSIPLAQTREEAFLARADDDHFILYRSGQISAYLVSGFTLTGGTPVSVKPGGSGAVDWGGYAIQNNPIAVVEDNRAIIFYEGFDNTSDPITYAAHCTFSGTTTTRHSTLLFSNDYLIFRGEDIAEPVEEVAEYQLTLPIFMGRNQFLLGLRDAVEFNDHPEYGFDWWDFGLLYLIDTTLFDIEYNSLYLIGESSVGSTAFVTAWADGSLILNVIDLNLGQQVDSIILGYASLSQVLAKTYIAYPCALSNSAVFVFGRINNGVTVNHILFSNDGGSNFEVIENSWGADFAGAMVCRAADDYFVMRCNPEYSKLYQGSANGLGIKSTLPFAGPVEPHGLRQSIWDDSLLAVVDKDGEAQTVLYSFPPYLAWEDVTLNHPQTEVNAVVPL